MHERLNKFFKNQYFLFQSFIIQNDDHKPTMWHPNRVKCPFMIHALTHLIYSKALTHELKLHHIYQNELHNTHIEPPPHHLQILTKPTASHKKNEHSPLGQVNGTTTFDRHNLLNITGRCRRRRCFVSMGHGLEKIARICLAKLQNANLDGEVRACLSSAIGAHIRCQSYECENEYFSNFTSNLRIYDGSIARSYSIVCERLA